MKNTFGLDTESTRVERKQKRAAEGETCQDEVGLVSGEHEDRDVLLGQWGDDRLGNLGHAHRLRAARNVSAGGNIERQPDRSFHLQVL